MTDTGGKPRRLQNLADRHPVTSYFVATFIISWTGAFAVAAPKLLRGAHLTTLTGLMMFPAMLVGPPLAGIVMTRIASGKPGVKRLFARMRRIRAGRWYAALIIPPILVIFVLFLLKTFISPVYAPNSFILGITFGVAAGFFEEIGWTGFAFPAMAAQRSAFSASLLLGLLWGLWHLPVIDFLGTATPHRDYLLPYFFAFTAAMTAMRILISWLYANTSSVFLAQLMHMSSTGALVAFSPTRVTAAQEAFWYAVYACALWLAVGVVVLIWGVNLRTEAET